MNRTVRTLAVAVGVLVAAWGCGRKATTEPAAVAPAKDQGTAAPAEVITLSYANFPPPATFPCVQMERWAKEVAARTQGRVKVQTFPAGTLLGAKDMFDGVISGTADIGNFAMSYQPGRFPVSEAVDLPHFFPDARTASLVLSDLIAKYAPAEFAKVKVLTVFACPPATVMSAKEIRGLSDLKGLELRVSGTGADVMKRLGAVPVAMPQSETPEAIQKGVVKGVVSSLEVLKDMNYAAYCPFALKLNLNVVSFAVVMNRTRYEALPADVRKVMDDLYREQAEWTGKYVDDHVQEALTWAAEKQSHKLQPLSAADLAKVGELLQPMISEYVARVTAAGLPGEQIIKDVKDLQAKYSAAK